MVHICFVALLMHATLATATRVLSLPGDQIVQGGQPTDSICGSCCQQGSYCTATSSTALLNIGSSQVTVPTGTGMTCMLRSRSVAGAVDGGLCLPDVAQISSSAISTVCTDYLVVSELVPMLALFRPDPDFCCRICRVQHPRTL